MSDPTARKRYCRACGREAGLDGFCSDECLLAWDAFGDDLHQ